MKILYLIVFYWVTFIIITYFALTSISKLRLKFTLMHGHVSSEIKLQLFKFLIFISLRFNCISTFLGKYIQLSTLKIFYHVKTKKK